MTERCFFTFASGKKYLAMAFALARSYRYHNGTGIPFGIVSDQDYQVPSDLHWIIKKVVPSSVSGQGLEFKLRLLSLSPTPVSIFIDADSLIYSNVTGLFSTFNGMVPSVIGLKVTSGSWVDEDITAACKEFGLNYMIRYCGALYFLIDNPAGRKIFDYAWSLYQSERSFQRNERTMYDEPIMSVALSKFGVQPLFDDGNSWSDLVQWPYGSRINIFTGPPQFVNDPQRSNFKFWLPHGSYRPKILHVGSGNYNRKPWLFDAVRLKLHYQVRLSPAFSELLVNLFVIPVYNLIRKIIRST